MQLLKCALLVLLCAAAVPAKAAPPQCALPEPVRTSLDGKWNGWRLLQLADLRSDDQVLWRQHPLNGKRCPGLNTGKFDGAHKGVAFTLVRRSEQVVIVAMPQGDSYCVTILVPPARVPYFSVVNVFPPGTYKDFYAGTSVKIYTASVAVEAIEHSIKLFYFQNRSWQSLLISD
jgi:hypothetical protein